MPDPTGNVSTPAPAAHTPGRLRWKISDLSGDVLLRSDSTTIPIARVNDACGLPAEANAARLALAWNAHDRLVEACEAVERISALGFTYCPLCEYVEGAGHRADCLIGNVLAEVRAAQPKGGSDDR